MQKPVQPPRRTLPSVRCTDPAFVYRNADDTNLSVTFQRARQAIGLEQRQHQAHQSATQDQATASQRRRVRAGAAASLPLF